MAVLHFAFRCAITPDTRRLLANTLDKWNAGRVQELSDMALGRYADLADREDVHAAFRLGPDGAVLSWLQPNHISPGLAALVMLAPEFVAIPNLSASRDTNHDLLARHLPDLDWAERDVDHLVRGQPIEVMLQSSVAGVPSLKPGGFRETGGWTPPNAVQKLRRDLDRLASGMAQGADDAAQSAWSLLDRSRALDDARSMLAKLGADDWLVMAITH